jgi:hypothetical protein
MCLLCDAVNYRGLRWPAEAEQGEKGRFCLLGDLGGDQLAGTAPRREPVDDDDGVLGDGLLEGIGATRQCQHRGTWLGN